MEPGKRGPGLGVQQRGNPIPPPLGIIEVIHAMSGSMNTVGMRVSAVASTRDFSKDQPPIKRMKGRLEPIAFNDEDLEGTIQPHDDALVIAAWISGFLVKRVMVDQGSGADVMYPDLFKGLGLKNQDLAKYDSSLVSFDGRVVIPQGQISLLVSMEGKEIIVTLIVVNSFSPYTEILGRPWIHAMGAISSTLHMKVKFCTERGVATVRGTRKLLGNVLLPTLTGETNKPSTRKSLRKRLYSNYRNTEEREGLLVLRDWKRLRYYLIQTGIFKLGQA